MLKPAHSVSRDTLAYIPLLHQPLTTPRHPAARDDRGGEDGEQRLSTPNVHHPEIMRSILAGIVETGDVIGTDGPSRAVLAVTVDNWLIDELAALP